MLTLTANHIRKPIIVLSLIGSGLLFCLSVNAFESLLMFVLFGLVPGRSTPLPPDPLLAGYIIVTVISVLYMTRGSLVKLRKPSPALALPPRRRTKPRLKSA